MNFKMTTAEHKPGARPFWVQVCVTTWVPHLWSQLCPHHLQDDASRWALRGFRLPRSGWHDFPPSCSADWATSSVSCSLDHSWLLVVLTPEGRLQRMHRPDHVSPTLATPSDQFSLHPLRDCHCSSHAPLWCKIGSEMPPKGFLFFGIKRKTKLFLTTLKNSFFLCLGGMFCFCCFDFWKTLLHGKEMQRKNQVNTWEFPFCRLLLLEWILFLCHSLCIKWDLAE